MLERVMGFIWPTYDFILPLNRSFSGADKKAESSSRCYAHEAFVGGPNGNRPTFCEVVLPALIQQNLVESGLRFGWLLGHILFRLSGFVKE